MHSIVFPQRVLYLNPNRGNSGDFDTYGRGCEGTFAPSTSPTYAERANAEMSERVRLMQMLVATGECTTTAAAEKAIGTMTRERVFQISVLLSNGKTNDALAALYQHQIMRMGIMEAA